MRLLMRLSFACACLLLSSTATAQPIHGYPGKTAYNSPAEYPFLSAQGHWTNPALNMGMTAHTHVECTAPVWMETTTASFDLPCRILLFHTAGRVVRLDSLGFIRKIVWQATGTTAMPVMRGNPTGIVIFPMTVTVDPTMGDGIQTCCPVHSVPLHGWWHIGLEAVTVYDNGDGAGAQLIIPFFSVIDPTKAQPWWALQEFGARTRANDPHDTASFGTSRSEYPQGSVPPILTPLTAPVSMRVINSSYAHTLPPSTPRGTSQLVADADLHNGNPGQLLMEEQTGFVGGDPNGFDITFNPAQIGDGPHKITILWDQTTDGNTPGIGAGKALRSQFVVTVNVGGSVPPPPPPPPNPCVIDPLVISQVVTGNYPLLGWHGTATATDTRGCTGTVTQ